MQKSTKIIIIIFCLIMIILLSYRYFFHPNSNDIITLLPDTSPTKKKPTDPGGLVIPNSDSLVYETLKGSHNQRMKINLLPDPEKPMLIARRQEEAVKILDSIDDILNNIEFYETEYVEKDLENSNDSTDYIVPNLLPTKTEKDDEDRNELNDDSCISGTNLNIIKAFEDSLKIKNYNITDDHSAGYKMQLSSAYSEADANAEWNKIQKKHKNILKDANLIIKKVKGKNERIFFLVMAGSYSSLSHAKLVCKKLSRRKQNCIITK